MTIPLTSIVVKSRQRFTDYKVDDLKQSIQDNGLIQPIVIEQTSDGLFRLIAGGRRLKAITELGHTHVYHGETYNPEKPGFVFGKELPEDVLRELELLENTHREDLTWQENCIAVAEIHELKRIKSAVDGEKWGQRETGKLLRTSLGAVSWAVTIAKELTTNKSSDLWKCSTMSEAQQILLKRKQKEIDEVLFNRRKQHLQNEIPNTNPKAETPSQVETIPSDIDEAKRVYLSNPHNPPERFEEYWSTRQKQIDENRRTVSFRHRLHQCDAIEFMWREENKGVFDHVITDIPYGIEMDNLNQTADRSKIESVEAEHDVEYNLELIQKFYPAAFHCTKESAFVITWCDVFLFRFMHDVAEKAGFAVQRWPFHWIKTNTCQNETAQYNFTKKIEHAIVCRKPRTTLVETGPANYVVASRDDEITKNISHPFAKPFAVWEPLIKAVSFKGQLVLEPFAGGGSGVLSLLKLERSFHACELNVSHFNELFQNVENYYRKIVPNVIFK